MGWLYGPRRTAGKFDFLKEMLARGYKDGRKGGEGIVACATREGVAYMAYRERDGRVVALVYPYEARNGKFGYKDMGEDSLPHHFGCPASVFAQLTPLPELSPEAEARIAELEARYEQGGLSASAYAELWREIFALDPHHYARTWRKRVQANIEEEKATKQALQGLKPGDRVRFRGSYNIPGLGPTREFELVDPEQGVFKAPDGATYRLSAWRKNFVEVAA